MQENKFTVLMTVYKNDNSVYFEQALDSILNQSVVPNEIVIVKDGPISNKNTKIINDFNKKFSNLKIIELKENVGQGNALNIGLKQCSYELVARMDSDDISRYKRFEYQLKIFQKNKKLVAVSGWTQDFSSLGNIYGIRKLPEKNSELKEFIKTKSPLNHGAVMYKKSKVLECGGYKNYIQVQDYFLWIDLMIKGMEFYNIQDVLLDVRVDDKYCRKSGWKYIREEIAVQKYMHKIGVISYFKLLKNLILKNTVRALPARAIFLIYTKYLRG